MKKVFVILAVLAALFVVSCSGLAVGGNSQGPERVSIVNWNVQTFFDARKDGVEYPEFLKSGSWCEDYYKDRLKRLCSVIEQLDADVFVMEELENEAVLQDISNFLAGEWNRRKVYDYACFAKEEGGAIGCGVLSRYPLEELTVHAFDCRGGEEVPKMRPLMQVQLVVGKKRLTLFVNHWKSMSGGEAETEKWRCLQEGVLAQRVALEYGLGNPVVLCGDFNRDIGDFCRGKKGGQILLRFGDCGAERAAVWASDEAGAERGAVCERGAAGAKSGADGKRIAYGAKQASGPSEGVLVDSAWYWQGELVQPGSYFFDGEWSRIDNFFTGGGAVVADFSVQTDGLWCDERTLEPVRYTVWNGKGYSDHLPVKCVVRF